MMKTIFTVFVLFGLLLNGHTQIKKLPVLKGTSATNYTRLAPEALNSRTAITVSTVTEIPRAYSNFRTALNETLTKKKLETKNAHIYFRGEYNHHDYLSIFPSLRGDHLLINFKSIANKRYRILLDVDGVFGNQCQNPKFQIINKGQSIIMPAKKGNNQLDFIVQSKNSGWFYLDAITKRTLTCNGQVFDKTKHGGSFVINFNKVVIKELQN